MTRLDYIVNIPDLIWSKYLYKLEIFEITFNNKTKKHHANNISLAKWQNNVD